MSGGCHSSHFTNRLIAMPGCISIGCLPHCWLTLEVNHPPLVELGDQAPRATVPHQHQVGDAAMPECGILALWAR
jgi:hypothetical protein